jgi:Purple acid Phosphatase, N-terminal domain
MNRLTWQLTTLVAAGSLLCASMTGAQIVPSEKRASRVRILSGPELEITRYDLAIITWTSDNPGGSPEHYGIVHYGTRPEDLSQTAKSPIRLNPAHPQTVFRVRMDGLKPKTTYYYTVESMEANGNSDGVKSTVKQFNTE